MSQILRDHVPLEDRCQLRLEVVSLDGETALISGLLDRYATVTSTVSGATARWTWPQVEYVITEQNGQFRSRGAS